MDGALATRIRDRSERPASSFESLPTTTLAQIVEQGVDCVKISIDGTIRHITTRAADALELSDPHGATGTPWADLWPDESRPIVEAARIRSSVGETVSFQVKRAGESGHTRWFEGTMFPVHGADGLVRGLVAVLHDVTSNELVRHALDTKTAEMRHRLRNTYSMISSLITNFSRGTPDRAKFAEQMVERLSALGAAQSLLVTTSRTACRIRDLMPALVGAFDTANCPVTIDDLSDAELDQAMADAIALVLGELAVNSDKHGALGSNGSIEVDVRRHPHLLEILWKERGDRLVEARSRPGGQGLRLMDRVARSMRGEFSIDWKANGLDAKLTIPLST
ncbi:sensor histidine kinase [Sphingomonas sp. 3-13AW]|uniref:sensor histidine kinase n=1 Tax=Sphingomonas sp. 3-13AW TaxID=3050450 RepID=UPI003BB4AC71